MTIKQKIQQALRHAVKNLGIEAEVKVDSAPEHAGADYATNAAFSLAKEMKKTPREAAEIIANGLRNNDELKQIVSGIEVAPPAFINFSLSQEAMLKEIENIMNASLVKQERRYLVEFAHPNTHKPFHIGHLRNITIGEAVSRLLESQGIEVIRANYQGDAGLHIAKALWGIMKLGFPSANDTRSRAKFLGEAYVEGNSAYEEDAKAKEEIKEINKKLYDKSDSELNKLYQTTRQWSLDYFDAIYRRVGTEFERLYFESETAERGKKIAEEALEKGILRESEGAVIYPGEDDGLHTRVFLTSEGLPTYEAKDLGLASLQAAEFNPDKIIHVVGKEQKEYFDVLFKVLEKYSPAVRAKELYLPYGWVSIKGGKMSSRKGNVILGEELLDKAKEKICTQYSTEEKIAEQIAVGAVKYSFLRAGILQDMVFDMEQSISLEGDSGPYLQYTYARTRSVLQKAKAENGIQGSIRVNEEERAVARNIIKFPDALLAAADSYAPHILCGFLFDLAHTYNNFYSKHKIIGSENEALRLYLTNITGEVIKRGLLLLGIESPAKM